MPFSISKKDLKCIDERIAAERSLQGLRELAQRLADDLRQAHDRLGRTPTNSSMPPGSVGPWLSVAGADDSEPGEDDGDEEQAREAAQVPRAGEEEASPRDEQDKSKAAAGMEQSAPKKRSPGRQRGAIGHGRTQSLAVDHHESHHPERCQCCGAPLQPAADAECIGGWDVIEWVSLHNKPPQGQQPDDQGGAALRLGLRLGVRLEVTRHLLMQQRCACGQVTAAQPHCVADDTALWPKVRLGERRLLGPQLASVVVYLVMRMRSPRRKVQELMFDLFGLQLSVGLIAQTVLEAGRAAEAHDEALTQDLIEAVLVHADETPWRESGHLQWLWAFCSLATALYVIGPRTADMLTLANFKGVLMSDGYVVYRDFVNRLRCWAHLARKTKGLAESSHQRVAQVGQQLLQHVDALMLAVYAARQAKAKQQPPASHDEQVAAFKQLCQQYQNTSLPRVGEVVREFLKDWDTIMRPLDEPHLPLTNNHGERMVRHHVQARHITSGTRSMAGTRAYAWLSSVIDTCRLRGASSLQTVAATIAASRKGLPPPPLPPIPDRLRGWDALVAA